MTLWRVLTRILQWTTPRTVENTMNERQMEVETVSETLRIGSLG
jgi:hypothetical protein